MIVLEGKSFKMRQIGKICSRNRKEVIHWNPKVVPLQEMLDTKKPTKIVYEKDIENIHFFEGLDFPTIYSVRPTSLVYIITDKDKNINKVEYLSLNKFKNVIILSYNCQERPKTPLYCGSITDIELWRELKGTGWVSSTNNSLYGEWFSIGGCGEFIDCEYLTDLKPFKTSSCISYETYCGVFGLI